MAKKIYVWGFDPQIIRDFVADWAEVVELLELPSQAPDSLMIVVNNPKFNEWAKACTMADGIQPCPILAYCSGAGRYIDGVVGEDYWEDLEAWLECEHVFKASLMGSDVPAHFLRELGDRKFSEVPIAEIPFGDEKWAPADSPMRRHLERCVVCRTALNKSVETRNAIAREFGLR